MRNWKKIKNGKVYALEKDGLSVTFRPAISELSIGEVRRRDNFLDIEVNPLEGGIDYWGNPTLMKEYESTLLSAGGLTKIARTKLQFLLEQFEIEKEAIENQGCRMTNLYDWYPPSYSPS